LRTGRPVGSIEIDRFFATRPGDAAVELPLEEAERRYAGLFTEAVQRADLNSPPSVVPNVSCRL
jgi:6-phosphofructokinase